MINQRLSKLAKAEGAPIIGAEAYSYEQFDFVFTSGIQAQCDPKNWQPGLSLIETEIRRALQHGFTDAELAQVTSPIGVPGIPGKAPEVIAVAVAAQLLQLGD